MIPRQISIGARFHLVANRLPLQPATVRSLATRREPTFATRFAPSSSRTNFARHLHFNAANMSSAGAFSAAESSNAAASSGTSKDTTASTNEQCGEKKQEKEVEKLPPLKGAEFRAYNRLAEHMDLFHAHFRTAWNSLWTAACAGNSNKYKGRGGRSIINDGLAFVAQLEIHHNIEETYIFPILARRMPEFKNDGKGGKGAAELLRQHREIHDGMEGMRKYLRGCRDSEQDLDMDALKTQMQSWGTVLWTHLDQEVETLGAENMRKYWTVEEIRQIPM
ncbi:hypothetical protein F4677DRAFT_430877 [Hypoxylon crocopeplum]|nr:hypothetical protein F4677DRAFT_430877 [Hypoxylon crocopeplum]